VIRISTEPIGTNVLLRWNGGAPPYQLEGAPTLPFTNWNSLGTFTSNSASVSLQSNAMFFRIRGS